MMISLSEFHSLRLSTRILAHEGALEPVNEHAVRTKFLKKAKKCQNSVETVQRMTTVTIFSSNFNFYDFIADLELLLTRFPKNL